MESEQVQDKIEVQPSAEGKVPDARHTSITGAMSRSWASFRRGLSLTVEFARRLDPLSATGNVSGKREIFLLFFIPVLCFCGVLTAAWLAGVAYAPGCNSASNFIANLFFQPTRDSTCRFVPFLSDVPMIILSITSPFAFVAYRLLRRRLASLFNALKSTGLLLNSHESTSKISGGIERLERVVDLSPVRWIGIFSASVAMTTWLYWRNLREGDLFNTLATTAADGSTNTAQLRDSWWANYHHHPLLAALCVFIGSIGVMYALRAGWLYLRLGFVLWATRKTTPEDLPIHYVPRWQDKSYGWSPVTGVLMLVYVSTINFGISMVSVFDMLRNEKWTLAVAGAFTLLGIVSNLTIIWTSIHRILAAHSAVGVRLRKELSDRTAPPTLTPEEAFFARQELATWRRIPVASFVGSAIKILPGLYALVQFARILFT